MPASESGPYNYLHRFVLDGADARRSQEWLRYLFVAGAVDDGDRMRQEIGEGVEGFDGAFGAAGQIQD